MGTSLFNTTPAATYPALIKVGDNTTLSATLKTLSDGSGNDSALQLSTRRLGILQDTGVTTQTSSVIQATTTNANLVIAPNGTGALVASIPDGTATGGNARGNNAVDLQTGRTASNQVASGVGSTISGGGVNIASANLSTVVGGSFCQSTGDWAISGGSINIASGFYSNCIGGSTNTASSAHSTVSGGQSNTASTGTHATVVGGQGNTASGVWSTASGYNNTASGSGSFAGGREGTIASGQTSFAFGRSCLATQKNSISTGEGAIAYLFAMRSHSGVGGVARNGEIQVSDLIASRNSSLTSAATTVLSLDGTGTTNLIIPDGNNRLWAVKVVATAFVTVAGGTLVLGDSYMGEFTLLFKRVGGTSSVVGVNSANLIYDTNMATAAFTFAAGASQDLQITFKAPTTASATTFRCVAKVELVEVAY